jgi:Carboxypeptidase regulatory-like domain
MHRDFSCAWRSAIAWLFLIALLLVSNSSLQAQTPGTGALTGTVTDSSGAVIPNVKITATSVDTGQSRTATTGPDGTYKIGLLPPGNYRVTFEASGFKPVEIPSAAVNVTETEVLDRALEVGAQTQTVTVEGEVETIQTTSSALGTVATTRTMTELPLNTRNFTNLLAMSAGANSSVQDASQIGKGGSFIAVNGGGFGQNTYLQDGVDVDDWFSFNTGAEGLSGGSFPIPNPDAIAEFKIQTSSYDAGYGRNPGANVNVVTKGGTNNFHGAAFEFFRNTALNANNWFFNFNGLQKPVLNSNQYGGVFGGPVKKDKLFFFASYQETDQKNGLTGFGSSNATLPPVPIGNRGTCPTGWTTISQCDAAAQTFVPSLAAAVCPGNHPGDNKYITNVAASVQVQCSAAGTNGLFNMNPVAINILQLKLANGDYLIPSPGTLNPARANTFLPWTFSDPATFHDHNFMGNWDYVINSKHTLTGRYIYEADPIQAPFAVQNSTQVQSFLPGQPVQTTHQDHAATLRLTSVLTNNLVNQGYVAYQRFNSVAPITVPFTNSQVGVADLNPGEDFMSFFTLTGLFQFGQQYQYGLNNPTNQYQAGDQISWTRGRHTLRFGFGAEQVQTRTDFPGHGVGNPTFPKFADFLIGRAGGCGAAAVPTTINPAGCNGSSSSNLNSVGTFTTLNSAFAGYFRVLDLNGFVQDDLKINSRLTLNLGVRWEYDGYVTEKHGLQSNIWPSLVANTALPGSTPQTGSLAGFVVPGNYNGPIPAGLTVNGNNSVNQNGAPKDDFAPRIGFAWEPTGNTRWVLRGGAGYFYDVMPGVTLLNVLEVTSPALLPPVISGLTSASLANPWQIPQGIIPGLAGTAGFSPRWVNLGDRVSTGITSSNLSQNAIQQDIGVPLTYEWNLNTQYEFLPNWVLELGYVGSHGIRQASVSRATLQGQAGTQPYNLAQLAGPNCASCALTGVTTNTVTNVPLRVPELGVSAQNNEIATLGSYKFNSLQVTVRKQFSKGFQLQAAYTWSRAFIALPFGINTAPYLVENYEPNNNYHPNRLVLNYVWNLPLGHAQGWKGALVDGWSVSGVTTIQDGVPLTIEDTGGSIFLGGQGVGSVSGFSSTAQICPGKTYADLLTSGSIQDRVTSGLTQGPGYLNGKTQGVLCALPTIGATPGVAGTGGSGFGNMGGGVVLGPPQSNWDMSLAKNFAVRERQTLQFRAEFFNTFNHPQFAIPNTLVSSTTYGQISSTSVNPRIIQLALKFSF